MGKREIKDSKKVKNTRQIDGKDKKKKSKKKHKKLKMFFMVLILVAFIAVIVLSAVFVAHFKVAKDEFNPDELVIGESNSTIVDSQGNTIATLNGDEKRKIIPLNEMGKYLPNAYIAIEDERFRQHSGVDFKRTGAAILNFVSKSGSTSFGGSTITQQLIKNATSDKDKTIDRKIKEWARAYKVEETLSKDQILETYLNILFVGQDYYGVELGSMYYFNKSAKELSLAECCYLAGINHSPNAYKPFKEDPDGSMADKIKTRTRTVLNKMHDLGYIDTEDEYKVALEQIENGLVFTKGEIVQNIYSYHTDALITQLVEDLAEEKGISKDVATTYLYGGGLTIHSTQVSSIQNIAEEEVKKEKYILKSRKNEGAYAEGAIVIIEPSTGYVVGCVGGLGEKTESRGLNRATQSPRQTGSSFKPIAVVGPALQEGLITASSIYNDTITTFPGNYTPKDYNTPRGLITVRQAVETSQNIPFVSIMQQMGIDTAKEYLKKMGITTLTDKDVGLSIAIGGLSKGVTPLEMCGAYSTIANNGVYIEPTFYTKVEDSKGNVILEAKQEKTKVFDEDVDYILKTIVQEPVVGAAGTARYCQIPNINTAAKTGTTNDDNDRWLAGFTPYYSAVAWYGYDKNEEVKYNGTNPAGLLWSGVMKAIHEGLDGKLFEQPSGIVQATVCRETGLCATESCSNVYVEKFTKGSVPEVCSGHVVETPPEEPVVENTTNTNTVANKVENTVANKVENKVQNTNKDNSNNNQVHTEPPKDNNKVDSNTNTATSPADNTSVTPTNTTNTTQTSGTVQ